MQNQQWVEIPNPKVRAFVLDDFMFYVIPQMGDILMVIHDDAHDLNRGFVEFLTVEEIQAKYGVDLNAVVA